MGVILRTGRSSAVGLGPFGLFFAAIGGLFYVALLLLVTAAVAIGAGAVWGAKWVRSRRRPQVATPQPLPGVEPWARGHREISATERVIAAQHRR